MPFALFRRTSRIKINDDDDDDDDAILQCFWFARVLQRRVDDKWKKVGFISTVDQLLIYYLYLAGSYDTRAGS